MRAACEPVNGLRGLHDFEFLGVVSAKVVFDQRTIAQIDGQQAAGLNAGLAQPGERNTRSVARWLAAQVRLQERRLAPEWLRQLHPVAGIPRAKQTLRRYTEL